MQLIILLMLALAGGNAEAFRQVKPVIESLGGGEALQAIEKAEEISTMLTAVQAMAEGMKGGNSSAAPAGGEEFSQHGFPLAPISAIADENITCCLSRYVSLGE